MIKEVSEIFDSFSESIERLSEILNMPKTVPNRDSAIKRFELTFELAWKAIKEHLKDKGVVCRSPKDCLMQAFKLGLIQDHPLWLKMIEDRNLSVHTYNERLADDIYERAKSYLAFFNELKNALTAIYEQQG